MTDHAQRKELIRAYKESPRPMGVYRIRNRVSGRSLIGTSVDLPAILNRHRFQLRMGNHRTRELQDDWNQLGAEAFTFEVLDELDPPKEESPDPAAELEVLDQLWRERQRDAGDASY